MSNNYEDKNPAERFAEFLRLKNKLDAFNEKNQSELADRVFAQMCEAIREEIGQMYAGYSVNVNCDTNYSD